jgi:hypothetical protein
MKRMPGLLAMGMLLVIVAASSFVLGAKSSNHRVGVESMSVQAMQWFNHLLIFRELESDLENGCSEEALEKVRKSIDMEMTYLSSTYGTYKNTWVSGYISDRDPDLTSELNNYQTKYPGGPIKPKCY